MNRLKECRLNKGIQQKAVASELGVSIQSVVYWESGTRMPTMAKLQKLAELYGVPVSYLLDVEPSEEIKKETPTDQIGERKAKLVELLMDLSDSEVQRLSDFVAGMKSSR